MTDKDNTISGNPYKIYTPEWVDHYMSQFTNLATTYDYGDTLKMLLNQIHVLEKLLNFHLNFHYKKINRLYKFVAILSILLVIAVCIIICVVLYLN